MTQVTAAGFGAGGTSLPSRRGGPCEAPGIGDGICEANGTCTIALHCGHDARLPAALKGTFSARPQPVQ